MNTAGNTVYEIDPKVAESLFRPNLVQRPQMVSIVNRPGESGDSVPWKGWSHVGKNIEEVPGRAA